jgi:membrane complex biogenesis BtpA family protein
MIALPPLPEGLNSTIERALGDLDTLQQQGIDGVCVENDYDQPHQLTVGPEIVAAFTIIAKEVKRNANVPVGLQVLLNDWRSSLAIARIIDAQFVRLDFFVDKVRIAAGVIEPEPDAVIAYRKKLKAENVLLLTDVQVKYSQLLEAGKSLTASISQAIAHQSDAIIISGKVTGESPSMEDLNEARTAAGDFPVLIGSGTTAENAGELLRYADGAIVGTALKNSLASHERIIGQRVKQLMDAVKII